MARKLQASSEIEPTIEDNLPNVVGTNKDVENSDKETSPPTPHSTSSYSEVAPVMTTIATTMEEQMANLTKMIGRIDSYRPVKGVHHEDHQI